MGRRVQLGHRGECISASRSELDGCRRGYDPASDTLDEREADLLLERVEVLADGRRTVAETARGFAHGTTGDDRSEDAQTVEIEHIQIVRHRRMNVRSLLLVLNALAAGTLSHVRTAHR
jgi:hypothetical protein